MDGRISAAAPLALADQLQLSLLMIVKRVNSSFCARTVQITLAKSTDKCSPIAEISLSLKIC